MISRVVVACALALGVISPVVADDGIRDQYATVYCGRADCMTDPYGKAHCAKQCGGVMRDQFGNVLCGVGYCAVDDTGRVLCSTRPGGTVARDSYGKVTCTWGCQDGRAQLCEDLR